MNALKRFALTAALAAGVVGGASAAEICSGCAYRYDGDGKAGDTAAVQTMAASYIGTYNPNANFPGGGDLSIGLRHFGLTTSFVDWWVFQIDPIGNLDWSMTFNPIDAISNFKSTLYKLDGLSLGDGTGATCTANSGPGDAGTAGFCGSIGSGDTGTLVASSVTGTNANQHNLSGKLLFGWYIVKVEGTVSGGDATNGYSGNLTTRPIPEPGTLALAALGLMAAGAGLRRRAK